MNLRAWTKDLTWFFAYLLFIATLGPLLFGYHLAELNTPLDVITCKRKSLSTTASTNLPQCIPMNPAEIGLVSSIFTLGGFIGALTAGPIASNRGRLTAMLYATAPSIVGPICAAVASNIPVMAVGRLISGLGAGAALVAVPVYIAETAPPGEKGFFGSFTQVMVNVGILLSQLLGYFLSYEQMWRIVLAVAGGIGLMQALGLLLFVESPKWLVDKGHPHEAKSILQRIRGEEFDVEEEVAGWGLEHRQDLDDEEETLLSEQDRMSHHSGSSGAKKHAKNEVVGMFQVLRHPDYNKAVFAVIMVMVAQQLTGINSIIMYGVNVLTSLLQSNSAVLNLGVSALNIIVTISCAPLVDKLGRKTCLLGSTAGMGISALLFGIGMLKQIPFLSAATVLTFVASFGLGLGPIPFILSSELVGPEAVGATQGWALGASWISTFVVAQFFPIANEALGPGKIYFIFTAIAAAFFVFIGWFVPETKGKKDADEVWGRSNQRQD